jgi:CxxC motif-containing protein (DUF1111 family)
LFGFALVGTGMLLLAVAAAPVLVGAQAVSNAGPVDHGIRGGPNGAGGPFTTLTAVELAFFTSSKKTFEEVDVVEDGLGPRFNADSCAGCHAQPDVGGTSPGPGGNPPTVNPQLAFGNSRNAIPSFITANGPVREARFKRNPDGSADGGVHALFTISGRSDAGACNINQPDFATQVSRGNVIFRIPTPVFGTGLIEAIPDTEILRNKAAFPDLKARLGITGRENRNGNDGTITRFGWKAQNKSLAIFAGEAYNVEQGVTNELFQNERDENAGCGNPALGIPEDETDFATGKVGDVIQFSSFMRFLAPPTPGPSTSSTDNGRQLFSAVGCGLCHTPQLQTGKSSVDALENTPANLFSDLLVHNMGSDLADDGRKASPMVGSSERHRCGGLASGCSSCTMAARIIS